MDPREWNLSTKNSKKDMYSETKEQDFDPMMGNQQKSIIKSIISGARASLNDPKRPETPADLPRHLFAGTDYSERPGSAYKVGQVADEALENFTRSSTAESKNRENQNIRPGSRPRKIPILEPIVRNKEITQKNRIIIK